MDEKALEQIAISTDITSYHKANTISPTFCSAKWHMVTLHLAHGDTHSCYHPWTHKIPLEEITNNPGAIHNTEYKKSQRKLMLQGERPKECEYCWKMEDLGHISDRIIRNDEKWAKFDLEQFQNLTGNEDVYPRHVEVSFTTTCNLKCSYCNPNVSSKWREEVREYGGYKTSTNFNNFSLKGEKVRFIKESEYNPYIEAFWKYLPEIYPHLKVLRVTGGEPLLSKHTFKLLDYVAKHENNQLDMAVNSNFCVPNEQIDKMMARALSLTQSNTVKNFTVFLSIDATGKQAEYGRNGLDWDQFKSNVHKYLQTVTGCRLVFTVTFNVFSVPDFPNLIKFFHELRQTYQSSIGFDTPFLRYPPHQCINILPDEFVAYLKEAEEYMILTLGKPNGFNQLEIDKVKRLQAFMLHKEDNTDTYRKDFAIFVDEHDRRRGTNFLETFPEYLDFYNLCKSIE